MGSVAEFKAAVAFIEKHKIRPIVHTVLKGLDKAEDGFSMMKTSTFILQCCKVAAHMLLQRRAIWQDRH